MAYDQLDPIGDQRIDFAAAMVSHVIANAWRDKDSKPHPIADFLPPWLAEPKPKQTIAEQIAMARAITLGLGGTDLTRESS